MSTHNFYQPPLRHQGRLTAKKTLARGLSTPSSVLRHVNSRGEPSNRQGKDRHSPKKPKVYLPPILQHQVAQDVAHKNSGTNDFPPLHRASARSSSAFSESEFPPTHQSPSSISSILVPPPPIAGQPGRATSRRLPPREGPARRHSVTVWISFRSASLLAQCFVSQSRREITTEAGKSCVSVSQCACGPFLGQAPRPEQRRSRCEAVCDTSKRRAEEAARPRKQLPEPPSAREILRMGDVQVTPVWPHWPAKKI